MFPSVRLFDTIPIHGFGLMIVVGFLVATAVSSREARRRGLPDCMQNLGMVMLFCGILGGRIFYFVQFFEEQFRGGSWWEFFRIWNGGLVFYGGAVGGLAGGLAYIALFRLPLADTLDAASLGVPIGMAFGRVGCFLNGCCYGQRCSEDFTLGVQFPTSSPAYRRQVEEGVVAPLDQALPVHPVQLYQGVHDLLLFGALLLIFRGRAAPRGAGLPILFVLYGVGRFFLEDLRGDHHRSIAGWTVSQYVSVLTSCTFAIVSICLYYKSLRTTSGGAAKKAEETG
jgi:phosphatidylglycerol:prolipoprotein diacylglycerol transferase